MVASGSFRDSALGVIPTDWEIHPIIDCADYVDYRGKTPRKTSSGILLVTARNIRSGFIDYKASTEYIATSEYESAMQRGKPQVGDVLITTEAPLGMVATVDRCDIALAQRVIKYRGKSSELDNTFLKYFLLSPRFQLVLLSNSSGSTAKGIKGSVLHRLPIAKPPKAEQQRIATVLSDTDALIFSLEKLIEKKRNIKQGVMQELLTGKRRLPGFSGEWTVRKLNETSWFQEGPGVRNYQFTISGVKLLNGTNIFRGSLSLNTTTRFISSEEAHGTYSHFLADEGDIVIASSGISVDKFDEKVAIITRRDLPLCMNTSTIRFKPKSDLLDRSFLFFFLQSSGFKDQIKQQATGSAQLNFGPFHLKRIDIELPPTLAEQERIASTLADCESEIRAIEARHLKAISLKQALMQTLLTGKIRLTT